jgi:hypothetical protein
LFYATAGKIFTERSRTTSLLAALNVLYPDIQQLDEEKQNYIVLCYSRQRLARRSRTISLSVALQLLFTARQAKTQREEAKPHHFGFCGHAFDRFFSFFALHFP